MQMSFTWSNTSAQCRINDRQRSKFVYNVHNIVMTRRPNHVPTSRSFSFRFSAAGTSSTPRASHLQNNSTCTHEQRCNMAPGISVRDYIRWATDPAPNEPTTTLVLTSDGNRFVDIRINKKSSEAVPTLAQDAALLPLSQLDMAMAGTSHSEPVQGPNGQGLTKSTWKHWIHSHYRDAESVVDQGLMHLQPDGRVLETGTMVNLATGKLTDYEEMWRDPPASSTGRADGKVVCVVLQTEDETSEARGMVVRLGQFVQGIVRVGEAVALERWEWREEDGWKRTARIGDMFLPCGIAMEEHRLTLGANVKFGHLEWEVVEMTLT